MVCGCSWSIHTVQEIPTTEANPFNWNQLLAETLPDATPARFFPTFVSIGVTGMEKARKCHLGRLFFQ